MSSKDVTYTLQQVKLQWSLPTVWSEMNGQPVRIWKKLNAFSVWWHGMGSHHHGQSFCVPGPQTLTLGSSCHFLSHEFFSFCGHIQHCGLSIIDLAYSQKQSITDHVEWSDLACQRNKIIVIHIFDPCQTHYYHACIWIIYGHWIDWVWGGLLQKPQHDLILPWSSACHKLCPKDLSIQL